MRIANLPVLALLAAASLAGCSTADAPATASDPAPTPPPASASNELVVIVGPNEGLFVDGWSVGIDELAELARQRSARSAVIRPNGSFTPDFAHALKAQQALQAAGVQRVTIEGREP